jgi:hypothetical protein
VSTGLFASPFGKNPALAFVRCLSRSPHSSADFSKRRLDAAGKNDAQNFTLDRDGQTILPLPT